MLRITNIVRTIAIVAVLPVLLIGCQRSQPTGQVVATVNGIEITQRDVAAELTASPPGDGDPKDVQARALQAVIMRKLLLAEAEKQGMDKSEDYGMLSRRADEILLGKALLSTWARAHPAPTATEIAQFQSANPQIFGERSVFIVDKITAKGAIDPAVTSAFKTMTAVAAYLDANRIAYNRASISLDSAQLSPEAFRQTAAISPGQIETVRQGDQTSFSAIVTRLNQPVIGESASSLAVQVLVERAAGQRASDLRKSATVLIRKVANVPGSAPTHATPSTRPSQPTGASNSVGRAL